MKSIDPFDYLKIFEILDDSSAIGITNSFIGLLMVLGGLGLVISLIITSCQMIIAGNNPLDMHEAKKSISSKLVIAIALFSAVELIGVVYYTVKRFLI